MFRINQKILSGERNVARSDPGKIPGYLALSAKVRRVAARLTAETGQTWTPAEVQETIWSWAKTLYELSEAEGVSAVDYLRSGKLSDEAIRSAPAFDTLLTGTSTIRDMLEAAGYGPQLRALDADRTTPGPRSRPTRSLGRGARDEDYTPTRAELRSARRLDAVRAARDAASQARRVDDVLYQEEDGPPDTTGFWALRAARKPQAQATRVPLVTSRDPEVEERLRAAKGEPKVGFLKRISEGLAHIPKLRHHFTEISPSRSPMEAAAHETLLEQERAARFGQVAAYNRVSEILSGLTVGQVDTFSRALILPPKDVEGLYAEVVAVRHKSAAAVA